MAGKPGPRPHTWKVQGDVPHTQYVAWQRMRAQAHYRGEAWTLTFDEFQSIWTPYWHLRGRSNTSYCLTREDPNGAWDKTNTICIPRLDQLRRAHEFTRKTRRMKNGN